MATHHIPMNREDAIDGIMLAFVEASTLPQNKSLPGNVFHLAAESALVALGVTDDELGAWGQRTMQKILGDLS